MVQSVIEHKKYANMEIERIYYRNNLSLRAYNVCCENGFESIADLKAHYNENGDFMSVPKVGRRTNDELIELANLSSDIVKSEREFEFVERDFLKIIANLNDSEEELLNHYILDRRGQLRNRSRNALSQYLKRDFRIKTLTNELIVQPMSKIRNIPNVGLLTLKEITEFITDIKTYVYQIDANNDRYIIAQKNTALFVKNSFSIKYIPPEVLEPESVFKILDFLIRNNYFLTKNHNRVFKLKYQIYDGAECFTNEEISDKIGVTKERVRQINKRLQKKIQENLSFVNKVNDKSITYFKPEADYYLISDADVLVINQHAGTRFSKAFITFIIGLIRKADFDTIGEIDDVLGCRTYSVRQRHVWKEMYLVNKEISRAVDFEGMINDLNRRLNVRVEKSYFIQIEDYIHKFVRKNRSYTDLTSIISVFEIILKNEMGIDISGNNKIEIQRNSYKRIDEYAYEILEAIGEPTSAEVLTKKINEVFKDRNISVTSVRVLMTTEKGFVYIGREGVYGLKKWESERGDFKGGTIRSIAADYLRKHKDPKPIDDIVSHILIYRPTSNKDSISQNLRLEPHGKFTFYKGNRIGLSDKTYAENFRKKR